ncbi:MAG TPA: protein kinase [Pyrinomonadaceae bacterium]
MRADAQETCARKEAQGGGYKLALLGLNSHDPAPTKGRPQVGNHLHVNSSELNIGQTFSHYRLIKKLGEGGMGIVYTAEDTHLHRTVAVKFLSAERNRRVFHARFLREARAASKLNHPNIAAVYDYGEMDEGRPFIVMELIHGETLSKLLEAKTLSIEQRITIIKSVLEALTEAHAQGIVHRDIKPSNIVIGPREVVKVLDFGLAKSFLEESAAEPQAAAIMELPTQTLTGVVLGTPLYVSPEQATGAPVDPRSDIFSVGAVLYECIAGRPAFAAPSVVEIFAQVISSNPPAPPSRYNSTVPHTLDRIALKALARTIEDRYQSAEEFLEDLRRVQIEASDLAATPPKRVLGSSLDSLYRKIVSRGNTMRDSLQRRVSNGVNVTESRRSRKLRRGWLLFACLLTLALLLAGLRAYRFEDRKAPIDSIAVIPFVNESRDEDIEYISDGFTDALISSLSQLKGLKVISRNSVARYKGQEVDPAAVGMELKVAAILTGRISKTGDGIKVTVELIDARDRTRLWGEQYEQKSLDLFSTQEEIVSKVWEKLRTTESDVRKNMLTKRRPADPAIYELYVKGRWYWNKRTTEDHKQAILNFQQAIDLDPNFALAYAGLADCYALNGWVQPKDSYLRAKAAATRALELDATLGEAHATLGFIKSHYERDWTGAEIEYKQAINLSPNYATAHHWYADYLLARGAFDQALQELKLAQELDPLSPIINTDVGLFYFYTRQYDLAINHFQRMTDLYPNFFPAHFYLGWTYTQKGMFTEAIAHYQKALSISKGHSMVLAMLGYTYAISGRESKAREVIRELQELSKQKYVSPYRFAVIYTGLGDKDRAFEWLNKAYDDLDLLLIHVNVSPFFDLLRQDARFTELIRRLGLS